MNTNIKTYLDHVCNEIKYHSVHIPIREELESHILEQQESYLAQGDTEEIATQKALTQMGNAQEIGRYLHLTHKPQISWTIITLTAILIGFGIFVLSTYQMYLPDYNISAKQSIFILFSFLIAIGFYFYNYTNFYHYSFFLYGGISIFGMILLLLPANSYHWLSLGSVSLDIGTLFLLCYLLSLCGLSVLWQNAYRRDTVKLSTAILFAIMLTATVSMSKAVILIFISWGLLHYHIAHAPWVKHRKRTLILLYIIIICLLLLAILGLVATKPYFLHRLTGYLHPEADPYGAGYIATQIHTVLTEAQWFSGVAAEQHSFPTGQENIHFIVPNAHTDFIFIFILSRFGWGIALSLCIILFAFLLTLFNITKNIQEHYGKMLCQSITLFFAIQTVYYIAMNLSLLPPTSISLPFISYGGNMLLLDMILLAVFLNVYRRKNLYPSLFPFKNKKLPHIHITIEWNK